MSASQAAVRPGPDIFLSYRRSDRELAAELVAVLERRGPSVWWDADIAGGEDWRDTIVEQMSAARCLVIVFSEACNTSKQLKKELAVADHLDKEVIPVLIEPTEPRGFFLYELASRQWISIHPVAATEAGAGGPTARRATRGDGVVGEAGGRPVGPSRRHCRPRRRRPGRLVRARSRSWPRAARRPDPVPLDRPGAADDRRRDGARVRDRRGRRRIATAAFLFVTILALTALIAFPIRYYRHRVNPCRVAGGLVVVNVVFAALAAVAALSLVPADSGDGRRAGRLRGQRDDRARVPRRLIAVTSFVIFFVLSKLRARRAYRAGIVGL